MPESSAIAGRIERLRDYFDDARSLGPEAFASARGEAYLLHFGDLSRLQIPVRLAQTLQIDPPASPAEPEPHPQAHFLVFPLRRRPEIRRGSDDIWIGREQTCDVVVPDVSVSALHALVQADARAGYRIQDVGSRNGTFVDERPVPLTGQGEPVPLVPGARVRLGLVGLTFLRANSLHLLIRQLLG